LKTSGLEERGHLRGKGKKKKKSLLSGKKREFPQNLGQETNHVGTEILEEPRPSAEGDKWFDPKPQKKKRNGEEKKKRGPHEGRKEKLTAAMDVELTTCLLKLEGSWVIHTE